MTGSYAAQVIAAYVGIGLTIFLGLIAVTWRLGKLEQRVHDMQRDQEEQRDLIMEMVKGDRVAPGRRL